MATQFIDIYEKLEIIKDDKRIVNKPTNLLYKLYYAYLETAIARFRRDCYKDITSLTKFEQKEFGFISDGVSADYVLTSSILDGSTFYIGYAKDALTAYTEITSANYTYNSVTNTITISGITVPENYVVYIANYVIGSFTADLDYDEKAILVEGSLIPYLEEQATRNSLLKQMTYGGQQNVYSQANHIKEVRSTVKAQEDKVRLLIHDYSYKANPNRVRGLGGGLV